MSFKKNMVSAVLIFCMVFSAPMHLPAAAQTTPVYYDAAGIAVIAEKIIAWKKTSLGLSAGQSLLDAGLAATAGSYTDWYAVGAERLDHYSEGSSVFLAEIEKAVLTNIAAKSSTLTDIHRNILAIIAAGGDPTRIQNGGSEQNLISDYVYNRGLTASLGAQGITGWIWGLVVVDSMQYPIPSGSYSTRDAIIVEILKQQRSSNGFSLSGDAADPDITAMAVQALSPYYNSEKTYTYTRTIDQAVMTKTVRQAVDEAIVRLAAMQLATGDYRSWGQRSAETAAQVALALCCLGTDPQKDARFIKNGVTLMDGILLYQMPDGSFSHTLPATTSNSITTGQILYTMAAMIRQMKGMRKLYDFRQEQTATVKSAITSSIQDIASITAATAKTRLQSMLASYQAILDSERMYVYNYPVLADALKKAESSISGSSAGSVSQPGSGSSSMPGSGDAGSTPVSSDSGEGLPSAASSLSISGADSTISGDTSATSDEQKDRNRLLTTLFILLAVLAILLLAGWPKIRQVLRKRRGKSPDDKSEQDKNAEKDD